MKEDVAFEAITVAITARLLDHVLVPAVDAFGVSIA